MTTIANIFGKLLRVVALRGRSRPGSFTGERYPIDMQSLVSDQFGPKWLTSVLRHSKAIGADEVVEAIEIKQGSIPFGQLSDKGTARLILASGETIDTFIKFNVKGPLITRIFADVILGAAHAESVFYESVAPELERECGLRMPRCLFVEWNERTNEYVLMLEEIEFGNNGVRPFAYRTSSEWNDELILMLKVAATINGHFWGAQHPCLSAVPRMAARPWPVLSLLGKAGWPNVAKKRLKGKPTEAAPLLIYPKPSEELSELAMEMMAAASKLGAWLARPDSGLYTLCYHDVCLDNSFFIDPGDGGPVQVGILDFQFVCVGNIGVEWAWTMSLLPVELVVEHEAEILELVLTTIEAKAGVTIDREQFMDAYALGWLFPLLTHSLAVDAVMDDMSTEELLACTDDGSAVSNGILVRTHGIYNVMLALERHGVRERFDRWKSGAMQ